MSKLNWIVLKGLHIDQETSSADDVKIKKKK